MTKTNPKDVPGVRKACVSYVPAGVLMEVAVAMMEGGRKYARHSYRVVPILAAVYYDAAIGHLVSWWEGEDDDAESNMHHVTKAIASLVVLRDSMMTDCYDDDRPPKLPAGWREAINKKAIELIDRIPDCRPPYTEKGTYDGYDFMTALKEVDANLKVQDDYFERQQEPKP